MLIVGLIYANIILLEHIRLCSDPSGATGQNIHSVAPEGSEHTLRCSRRIRTYTQLLQKDQNISSGAPERSEHTLICSRSIVEFFCKIVIVDAIK
jgi:hypothetical protein